MELTMHAESSNRSVVLILMPLVFGWLFTQVQKYSRKWGIAGDNKNIMEKDSW